MGTVAGRHSGAPAPHTLLLDKRDSKAWGRPDHEAALLRRDQEAANIRREQQAAIRHEQEASLARHFQSQRNSMADPRNPLGLPPGALSGERLGSGVARIGQICNCWLVFLPDWANSGSV